MSPPLVFVSYSWDAREHQEWVRSVFVDGLRGRAVDARMDVYELSYGDKVDAFMDAFVAGCDHIAVICTANYAKRAAEDLGGVGYEKQLIRQFMRAGDPPKKVIPILRAGGQAAIPPFLGTRLFVDMQSDEHTEELLDELATVLWRASAPGPAGSRSSAVAGGQTASSRRSVTSEPELADVESAP
jgi:hypothetical protein